LAEIRNPNLQTQGPGGTPTGGGGDMRTTIGFAVLLLVVLLGYQYFFKPKPAANAPAAQTQSQTQPDASGQAMTPGSAMTAAPAMNAIAAAAETETTVENEQYKIVFTNRGAQVKHWVLKKYKDTAGKPLDMVQPQVTAQFGLPLALFTYEPALSQTINQALYKVTVPDSGSDAAPSGSLIAPAALAFHYAANGLDVVKTLHFDSSYVVNVETQVTRNGSPVRALVEWPAGLGDMEEFLPSSSTRSQIKTQSFFSWSLDGKQDYVAASKVSGNETKEQPYSYAAITDLYFVAAFLPEDPAHTTLVTLRNSVNLPSDLSDPNSAKKPTDVLGLAIGNTSGPTKVRLFAGPKAMDVLASIHATANDGKPTGQSLQPLIQFGWMSILATPLYWILRFLNEHGVPNWGWDIIIATVVFNLLMLPTRLMMMKSSLKMMRIQPKVDALKKRYAGLKATDPKRAEMNAEMMELYKQENVNMYGGCLPLLIQMPLFFAYYRVLANVIELRQAQWFWLHDLSVADPLHILPILIIASMFLVQFITPSPGMDPNQRRMMAIMMPVIFGFSMWHFASGLALYWGTGNLINLAIQVTINRSAMGQEMQAIAAKRAAKKLGGNNSPRTIQGKR
jgi:YidC/Oxa1 family membrane protein insertase